MMFWLKNLGLGIKTNFKVEAIRNYFKDHWTLTLIGLAGLFNGLTWIMIWVYVERDQNLIPIHYNIAIGIDRIGDWQETLLFPGIGALIIIVNVIIAWLFRMEPILVRSILMATVLIQLFILLGLGFLVLEFI